MQWQICNTRLKMTVEKEAPLTLEDMTGGPYIFHIMDGRDKETRERKFLKVELDDWTVDAEKWAKKNFGGMQELFNKLMHIECTDDETIDAAVETAVYKMTAHSQKKIDERRGEKTTHEYLRSNINYKMLANVCHALYKMIEDSIPLDALKKTQETLSAMQMNTKMNTKKKIQK